MKKLFKVLLITLLTLAIFSGCKPESTTPTPVEPKPPVTNPTEPTTPVDPEPIATTLSVLMSKEDIIQLLDGEYTITTQEDGFAYNYSTTIKFDGIELIYGHNEEEMPDNAHLGVINITSNDIKFNYDFKIGDKALNVIEKCEGKFKRLFDHHNNSERLDVFKYLENKNGEQVETPYVITWRYSDEDAHYTSKDQIKDDTTITSIRIFEPID